MICAQIIDNVVYWVFDTMTVTGKDELPSFPKSNDDRIIIYKDITGLKVQENFIYNPETNTYSGEYIEKNNEQHVKIIEATQLDKIEANLDYLVLLNS